MQLLKNVFKGLLIALLSVLANSAYAQTCDINTQKSLEQTHVAYYTEVTQGDDAIFTIRYPLVGTTYTFSDNLGTTYSITYTSGTEEFIYINTGAVNAERRFSLKAQNGACTYQSGFDYKVTPVTTLKLATSVEHEWCGNGGAIRFTLIGTGANNNNYNFYYKKSNVPTYDTTTSLSLTGVTSLAAGKYDLLARPKSGTGDIEVKNIEIKKDLKDIDYTLSKIPATCASAGIGIKVDIKVDQWGNHSANYPVYYTLQDATGNDIPGKIKQTANTFTGLTPGTYRVKVENFCGASPTPKSITIASSNLTFTNLWGYPRPKEFNCDYVEFDSVLLYGTSLTEAYTSDTFPYPLTVKYVITAPSGAVYTPTYTINNKSDFYLYLPVGTRDDLGVENGFREHRIPKEYGEWKIAAEVEMCGTTTAIPAVTATLYNPIENAYVAPVPDENSSDTCFKKVLLTLGHKYIRDNSPILNTYLVLEQAPTTFNYTGAGFYQIPATHPNPLLRGKFVKKIKYNPQAYQTVVASDYTNLGDTFQFRLVDDECDTNRSNLMDAFTITTPPAPKPTNVAVRNVASCKDATATNAPYASMHIQRYVGADLDKIEVIEYNGNTTGTIPGTSLSLPYTLTASDRANNDNWYLRDLPPGNYKVRVTNVCGGVNVISKDLSGQTYSFSFAPGCEPIVQGRIDLAPTDDWRYTESSFVIQQFNEATQTWNQWAYSGLGFNQNINRKVTDEYLTRKGKFRVVRRISNLDNTFECMQVIAEKDFGGDLEEPDVIGVGCVGNKFHVVVIPKGGTGPFTYRLVHKIPAGSTTPDTSVARTQAGDNFFLDLDGTNLNTAYKFTVTDACPSTKDRELTLSNIRLPKIKAQKEYYCVGQSAVLKMDDLGPNITIEWYRSDNMTRVLATGHTLSIPTLTPDDFTHQYKVDIKIAGQPAAATCITNAISAYQFQQITTYPSYTAPTGVNTSKCMEGNGAMYFDLNTLFTGTTPITGGVTTTIEEASGVIAVPASGIININLSEVMGTHTFLYKILSPCGELITQATAKLTVARAFKPAVKTTIKVCNPSVTLNEVKQLINEGSPEVVAKQPIFHWYSSLSDAQAQTSEIAATTSINTPNGSSQDYYLRFTKNNYCTETIYKITIVGETSVTAKTLTNTACQITTVADLKALVDPADTANVLIYKNGGTVALADETIIEDNVGYTYAKNVYRCVTSPAPLNFNFTPRTAAKNERIEVCTFIGYYGGLHTKVKDIKDALQVLYPNATITVLGSSSGNWYVQTNPNSDVSITGYSGFKIQEAGKCESLPYVVRLAQNDITPVQAQSITTCEEIMAGELADQLQATYGYTNVEIIAGRSTAPLVRTALVDWNTALYFTAEATGKCRSPKVPLTLIKDPNVTTATAKTFEVCMTAGNTPRVSDLKDAIGGTVKIFIRNGAQWQLQADNAQVNPSSAYFYTLQAPGKCPSIKTPLIVSLHTKPANAPMVSPTVTLCPTAVSNVVSLDAYVTALPAHTLRWYPTATATAYTTTAPTINTQVTTKTTLEAYVVQVNANGCESPRAVVTITVDDTTTPTLTTPAPLVVDCKNAAASITTWLNSATATDSCGAVNLTNNYNAVKPADLCNNSGVVTVTFTATDLFGKTVTQTSTITLVHIEANTDTFTITNGANGGTTTLTIFDNDKVGTQTATPATVSMTVVTPATGGAGSGIPTLNSNGTITVPAGTKSGTYTIGYKICAAVASLTVCDNATVTVVVGQASLTTVGDTFTVTNGANGGSAGNVLTNDKYNGTTGLVGNTSVTLTWLTVPAGIQTATNGDLIVAAGTASGTYTVTYKLCENLNGNNNCSTATATIVVGQASLTAVGDTFTVTNGANGGVAGNVLTNDKYNGTTGLVGNASVTLTWLTVPAGIQTATNGDLTVAAGTASGTYTVTYKLCENLNGNNNCSTATATIVVGQATLTAVGDTFTVANGANGGSAGNVLTNDEYNGTTGLVGNASVTLTWLTVPAGIQTATNGDLSVAAGTASGTYEVTYKLCENLNGNNNCSTATATIVVGQATITARNNDFVISNGANGGTTSNVLADDIYNGTTGLVGNASITFTWNTVPTGIVANASGTVTVPAGTASGTYVLTYTICENLIGNNNCSSATVTVAVGVPLIRAYNDDDSTFHITNGANGGTTSSVLANDNLNGVTNPSINSVTLTWTNVPTGIQTHTDGTISVPAGTPAGTYTVSYRICERLNGSNCSSATVTVVVGQASLTAVDNTFTVTNTTTTTTDSVLNNDSYNGTTGLVGNASVTLTWLNVPTGIQTNTNGSLTVPAGIASGTYAVTYRLCEVLNNSNCSIATATIVVKGVATPTVTPTITANQDTYTHTVSSTTYTTTSNVLTNDRIGANPATVASVTIQTATPTTNSPYIDKNTGFVVIPSGTPTGTYTMTYYLCERANSSNCSTPTTVTVTVVGVSTPTAPINIVANPDGTVTIRTTIGGMVTSVLTNDTLEGLPVTIGTVSFTWTTATPTGFTLNNDGTISVASNTAVGFYTVSYTICATRGSDRACATSFVEVRVVSDVVTPTIEANGDTFTYTGTQLVGNILTNDKLNGVPNPSVNSVTISTSTPTTGNVPFINPSTGEVMVPPYTPSGTYTINYNVCVKGVSICSTASVVVIVPPTPTPTPTVVPVAVNDRATTPRNTPVTIDVLSNDTPNGATTPNVVTVPQNGTAVVNPDGTIEYTPHTGFKGVDTFVYELCNADGCATATVSIEVTHKLIVYNGISVGGDKNNHFHIAGIEAYPNNTVRIYNRWGVKVWEAQSYDNVRNVFKGISNGRVTIEAADKLPQGTYYYVIEYVDENNQQQSMVGWLYLKK